MKLEILAKARGKQNCPFDIEPKGNSERFFPVKARRQTCVGYLQLLSLGFRFPVICLLKFELDGLLNQKRKAPANFDMQPKAS
uniref:Uncharacterized protein n=1 Tax=Rhizophora mucronata TaxID=61149 RepID=A0A2P2J9B5_RHIMU